MRNLYETLELTKAASAQDIKRAYHRLAHQYHPDKNPGDKAAEERFKEASRAYDILSDAKRRSRYDRFGPAGVGLGSEAGFPGADFAQSVGESVGDLFQEIFGRHRSQSPSAKSRAPAARTATLNIDLPIAVLGGHAPLPLVRHERCAPCVGTGAKPGSVPQLCTQCSGTGSLRVKQGVFSIGKRCPNCSGQGRMTADPCPSCQGTGYTDRNATLKVPIPKGAQSGTALRLLGEGELSPSGVQGDLLVTLRVQEHPRYHQQDLDLACHWPITITEATLGAQLQVPFVDGTAVAVTIPPGSQHGDIIRLKGFGAYRLGRTERGDLCVTLHVEVPQDLSAEAQAHLQALQHIVDTAAHYPKRAAAQQALSSHSTENPRPTPQS